MRFLVAGLLSVCFLAAAHAPAFAGQATTYLGMIGKAGIVVELQEAGADGAFIGRYAYLKRGVDIPLHGKTIDSGFAIEEEKPCTYELCQSLDNGPIGAEWNVTLTAGGELLSGTWTEKASGNSLPVKLVRKASRVINDADKQNALRPSESAAVHFDGQTVISATDLPYDFLKMTPPWKKGAVRAIGSFAYRIDTDPRTTLYYPVVTTLGGADLATVNGWLAQQRLQLSLPAFECLGTGYIGGGWNGSIGGDSDGYLDEHPLVTLDYLTTRLLGLTESGVELCNMPRGDTFVRHRFMDVRTGRSLRIEHFLRGWVARTTDGKIVDPNSATARTPIIWGPSDELVGYIRKHRRKLDADMERDCDVDNSLGGIQGYFKGSSLVFEVSYRLADSTSCEGDILSVPLKDARPLLTAAGAKYFAELDQQ